MSALLRCFIAALSLASGQLAAAVEVSRPSYVPPPPAVSSGSIVQIIFSLLLVLAAVVLVGWLLKRMNLSQQGIGSQLKLIGGIAIGQRERIVLVEINDTWLVVGVGPGQIRTLHTCVKPEGEPANADPAVSTESAGKFAALLSTMLNQRPSNKKSNAP